LPSKPAAVAAAAGEKPEETEARLQSWLKEARTAFAQASEPSAETRLPLGIETEAFADYRRDLEQIISGIKQLEKTLAALPDARKTTESARALNTNWNGFSSGPPYSVLLIDELLNQQESIRGKSLSYQSSEELFTRRLTSIQEEAKLSEANSRRLQADATENASNDNAPAWRVTADRAKSRVLALRGAFLQSNLRLIQDQAETAKQQLALLDRQISIAKKQAIFSTEDLGKMKKAAEDRQAAFRKELAAIRKTQQEASAARAKAQASLDLLNRHLIC